MDLPTYTSIWRIEKRLYKLYDFRLPMPLPIGQITVFAAIAVPYVVLLTVLGLHFSHTLIWLYVLPPGVATWLVTRPVLEGKRLPELIASQLRYLAEPRVWCRMAPLAESDVVIVTARVWRLPPAVQATVRGQAAGRRLAGRGARQASRAGQVPLVRVAAGVAPAERRATAAAERSRPVRSPTAPPARSANPVPVSQPRVVAAPVIIESLATAGAGPAEPVGPALTERADLSASDLSASDLSASDPGASDPGASDPGASDPGASDPSPSGNRPVVTVVTGGAPPRVAPPVERVLAAPSGRRSDSRAGRVTVVPGGHRPGRPDHAQRDRARARLPIPGHRRVVVLGCTVGAGQTMTTLLTGEVLASLRPDSIAVLDLNPGGASLARRALTRPALSQAASLGPSRLIVLGSEPADAGRIADGDAADQAVAGPAAAASVFDQASALHQVVLADPSTSAVPRLLVTTDQLMLVAPASATAAHAIGMTMEWLEAHGHADLAAAAIMVMNGVSRRSVAHVEQAERVCVGRCRAIVRIPWDDQIKSQAANRMPSAAGSPPGQRWAGLLGQPTAAAYTALAGVLVSALTGLDVGQPDDQADGKHPATAGPGTGTGGPL